MTFTEELELTAAVDAQVQQLTTTGKLVVLGYLVGHDAEVVEHALDALRMSKRCPLCGALLAADGSHIAATSGAHIPATPAAAAVHAQEVIR